MSVFALSLWFLLSLSSQLGTAEQKAPNDETYWTSQHVPCPEGSDTRAGVHRRRPVSVSACASNPFNRKTQAFNLTCLSSTHPTLRIIPLCLSLLPANSASCCHLVLMVLIIPSGISLSLSACLLYSMSTSSHYFSLFSLIPPYMSSFLVQLQKCPG